jgi:hypothetical protein
MNKTIKVIGFSIFTVAFIILTTLVPACSGPDKLPIEYGKLESGSYTNDYFGFTITVPEAWATQHDLIDAEGSMLLLKCTKDNGYLGIGAEKIPPQARLDTGKDIHEDTMQLMQADSYTEGYNVSFPTEIYKDTITDIEFYVLEFDITFDDYYIQGKQYATIIGDYDFIISLMWSSEEYLPLLDSILGTLTFN